MLEKLAFAIPIWLFLARNYPNSKINSQMFILVWHRCGFALVAALIGLDSIHQCRQEVVRSLSTVHIRRLGHIVIVVIQLGRGRLVGRLMDNRIHRRSWGLTLGLGSSGGVDQTAKTTQQTETTDLKYFLNFSDESYEYEIKWKHEQGLVFLAMGEHEKMG